MKLGAGAPAAPATRKPGQSAHAGSSPGGFSLSQTCLRNLEKGALEKGCIKLSEIDFQIRDKFATIPLMYKMKYRQFCVNLARNLRQICATPPSRTPPSRDS